jgi:hypothetical protein
MNGHLVSYFKRFLLGERRFLLDSESGRKCDCVFTQRSFFTYHRLMSRQRTKLYTTFRECVYINWVAVRRCPVIPLSQTLAAAVD